jgi:hypothetical protein
MLADKYNMPMVLAACDIFLSTCQLGQVPASGNDVVKWLATADRLGLRATLQQCMNFVRHSKCLQEVQLVGCSAGSSCKTCIGSYSQPKRYCLRSRLLNKEFLDQLSRETLLQLLKM